MENDSFSIHGMINFLSRSMDLTVNGVVSVVSRLSSSSMDQWGGLMDKTLALSAGRSGSR